MSIVVRRNHQFFVDFALLVKSTSHAVLVTHVFSLPVETFCNGRCTPISYSALLSRSVWFPFILTMYNTVGRLATGQCNIIDMSVSVEGVQQTYHFQHISNWQIVCGVKCVLHAAGQPGTRLYSRETVRDLLPRVGRCDYP